MRFKVLFFLFIVIPNFLFSLEDLSNIIKPSLNSGTYNKDIELSFSSVDGVDIYYSFKDSKDKTYVKYIFPLSLSSMSGETREYNLNVTARDNFETLESLSFRYIIDKSVPETPVLNYTEGLYNKTLNLEFLETDSDIYYEIDSQKEKSFVLWNGEKIIISQEEKLTTEYIKSYSEDSAGNRSAVKVAGFTILPTPEEPVSLNILSPVEGVFLNSQLIYIDTSGYKWIRYSFNEVDPVARGTSYIKPVMIKAPGEYKLNVAAMPYSSNNILRKEIIFSIIDNKEIIINKASGVYSEELNLKFSISALNYTQEDRTVVSGDPTLPKFISIIPVPGVVKYQILRISEIDTEGEYRYFFALDKRIPAAPVISVSSGIPIAADTQVRILGVPGADIYYTLDGSTPDRYSSFYRRSFILEIPESRSKGSLLIKAVAYFNNRSISPVASKLVTFDVTKPEKPILQITGRTPAETVFEFINSSTNRIIYNISYDGSTPADPAFSSFKGEKIMKVRVPNGIDADIKIAAAYLNQAGNISETTKIDLNTIDSIPPAEPEISFDNSNVVITGEKNIWYSISYTGFKEDSEYQLYTSPVVMNLENEDFIKIFISSYSEDSSGNRSSVATLSKVVIDKRVPVLPAYSGIKDGSLYNNPRTLRFHTAEDIEVFYTLSNDSSIPEDPDPELSSKLEEYLFFDCPVDETRDYTIKLLASYSNSEKQSDIKTISFRIERISPRAPVIRSIRDGAVYNNDITINKNEEEDYLWILIKENIIPEDLTIANFESNGILLDNDYVIKLDEKIEKHFQLASLSIDEAGNAIISRDILGFTIDKLPPPPPEIKIDNSSRTFTTVRMLSSGLDDILYEISLDGTYPADPSEKSEIYNLPLQIEKNKYNTVYIKAKTIDSSGNLSNETITRKIIMENDELTSPSISVSQINSSEYIVSFPSIPGYTIFAKKGEGDFLRYTDPLSVDLRNQNFIDIFYYSESYPGRKSSVAVHRIEKITTTGDLITGISDNKIYNNGRVVWKSNESRIVRYEVAVGDNIPPGVNVFSPELTEPILFDAGIGETVKVTISVKEFSDNIPVLEKYDRIYSFVIDKTKPELPAYYGITNNGFFTEDRIVELVSDSSIYYKLTSDSTEIAGIEYVKYTEPLKFNVNQGKSVQYQLEVFAKDSAGNKSDLQNISFTIDKANIFVSLDGKDSNKGTREKPFRTLKKALQFSEESKRNTINITEGEFELKQTINLDSNISIIGGFKPGQWTSGAGITLINIPSRYSGNRSLLYIKSGEVLLKNITMTNINLKAPIIKLTGGILNLTNVSLFHANRSLPVTADILSGILVIKNSKLNFGSVLNGNLISAVNGNISIINSSIEGSGNVRNLNIFSIVDSDLQITNSKIFSSDGEKISFIVSSGSKIQVKDSIFTTGTALINNDIFVVESSNLLLTDFRLNTDNTSRILSVFDIDNSEVKINQSKFNLKAKTGISFSRTLNSTMEMENSEIITDSADEFVYLIKSDSSIIDLQNNNITTGIVDIFKGFEFFNSVSVFNGNKMIFGGGDTIFSAFLFKDSLSIEFISNILLSNNRSWISSEKQAAFTITGGKDSIVIKGNNIFGWNNLMVHNGRILKTASDLNNYRKFLDLPEENYSRDIK